MLFGNRDYNATNLCSYFWFCVLNFLLLTVLITALCFFLGACFLTFFVDAGGINLFIILACLICAVFLPIFTIIKLREKIGHPPIIPGEEIIRAYMKAKKQGLCPLITYCGTKK